MPTVRTTREVVVNVQDRAAARTLLHLPTS
jgi:hypothetical protein